MSLSAGDVAAWSTDDWIWDTKNFIAHPAHGAEERAAKRQCGGHASVLCSLPMPVTLPANGLSDSGSAYTNLCADPLGIQDPLWQVLICP